MYRARAVARLQNRRGRCCERQRCELLGGSGGMLPRKILKSTLSDMLFSASFHEIFLQNSVSLKCKNIAQNAYWSRDIYFQFKKVCRSVISRVIIHRRLERAWLIGCHECAAMLIIMMKAANQTMNGARYCFAFCFIKS